MTRKHDSIVMHSNTVTYVQDNQSGEGITFVFNINFSVLEPDLARVKEWPNWTNLESS